MVSKGGRIYLGEFSRIEKSIVYFKSTKASAFQGISLSQIQSLKLKDGNTIIKNGNLTKIRTVVDYEKLSVEEKAIYDAKKDAKKWLVYPPLALIGAGGLANAIFYIGEDIFNISDESILFPSIFGGFLGAVGSYYLFDKKNLEVIKTEDIQLYEKFYSEEFKKMKLKSIIISTSIVGLTAVAGAWMFFSSLDMSGYDACFDPRCD